jgi:GMP synthase-like glutamine amidotransferase
MNTPLKILILDNNRDPESYGCKDIVRWVHKFSPEGSEIMVRRSPGMDLPLDIQFDAMIISGSSTSCLETKESWIKPYDDFVFAQIQAAKPILGICYGHQTIARCLFREKGMEIKLGTAKDAELGWQSVDRTGDSAIFEGLGTKFMTYQSHYEEVTELPPGTRSFAETERCKIQAFEIIGKPIFAVQFHPEYDVEEAERCLAVKIKQKVRKDWILNAGKGRKLFDENVGKTIFGNFIKIAIEHSQH